MPKHERSPVPAAAEKRRSIATDEHIAQLGGGRHFAASQRFFDPGERPVEESRDPFLAESQVLDGPQGELSDLDFAPLECRGSVLPGVAPGLTRAGSACWWS